jgi:hypothetical protein
VVVDRKDPVAWAAYMREYRATHPEYKARQRQIERKRNANRTEPWPERPGYRPVRSLAKQRASRAVHRALKFGQLIRESCLFCDEPKTEAHHHDYTKPLEVTWLCRRHHRLVHRMVP